MVFFSFLKHKSLVCESDLSCNHKAQLLSLNSFAYICVTECN